MRATRAGSTAGRGTAAPRRTAPGSWPIGHVHLDRNLRLKPHTDPEAADPCQDDQSEQAFQPVGAKDCRSASTLAAGPLVDRWLNPAMLPGGALVGTGPGAGISVLFVVVGASDRLVMLGPYGVRRVRLVEELIADGQKSPLTAAKG